MHRLGLTIVGSILLWWKDTLYRFSFFLKIKILLTQWIERSAIRFVDVMQDRTFRLQQSAVAHAITKGE